MKKTKKMTPGNDTTLASEFRLVVYKKLERIEAQLDRIDSRVRQLESNIAVLNFKSGIYGAGGGLGAGALAYMFGQFMGS